MPTHELSSQDAVLGVCFVHVAIVAVAPGATVFMRHVPIAHDYTLLINTYMHV